MSVNTATITDVENALDALKTIIAEDPGIEGLQGKKLAAAVDALTIKTTVSSVFKRLQGNALRDFAVGKEEGKPGYGDDTKEQKIKEYVFIRFSSYMEDPKTSKEATRLFNAAYPPPSEPDINNQASEDVQEEI